MKKKKKITAQFYNELLYIKLLGFEEIFFYTSSLQSSHTFYLPTGLLMDEVKCLITN